MDPRKPIIALAALALQACALAPRDDWTPRDTAMEIASQALNAYDAHQTSQFRRYGIDEKHPLTAAVIGEQPSSREVVAFFAFNGFMHYVISRWLVPESRVVWQSANIAGTTYAIHTNCQRERELCRW